MSYVKVRHGCDEVALVVFAAAQLGASYGSGNPLFFLTMAMHYCFFNSLSTHMVLRHNFFILIKHHTHGMLWGHRGALLCR